MEETNTTEQSTICQFKALVPLGKRISCRLPARTIGLIEYIPSQSALMGLTCEILRNRCTAREHEREREERDIKSGLLKRLKKEWSKTPVDLLILVWKCSNPSPST